MSWMLFPDNPALSALSLAAIAIVFLYAARAPVHGLMAALSRVAAGSLRVGGRWLASAADGLRERNKFVLLAHARKGVEQEIQREFERITLKVQRDLGGYPALQRRLLDELTRVEDDYKKCGEVPPPPPDWVKATETIAGIKNMGDPLTQKILEDISKSMGPIYDKVIGAYRRSYEDRHKILKGFMPFWRSLEQTLAKVDRNMSGMQDGAARIDGLMDKYQEIQKSSEKVEHSLTAAASSQFVVAAIVVVIALGGAFVNFWLIQRPMSAMVGAGEYIVGNLEASHVAALVIILIESAMGLFLMETLRITHLFPGFNVMDDKMRRALVWVFFSILLILAGVEVGLAVMRDQIILADLAFKRDLAHSATAQAVADLGWMQKVPVAGQMILGFILPFALAFVAIPLEYFIHSARTVIGALLVFLLRVLSIALRIASNIFRQLGKALAMLFDALIFVPLSVERLVRSRDTGDPAAPGAQGRAS
ncbi:MAG: hypothetical protein WA210_16855 [Burkholderiaceae bacterium]